MNSKAKSSDVNANATIDNIESNVESTAHNTAEGVQQLRQASKHQRSARTKLCCLALIIVIVAAVIAGVLYFTLH